MPPLPVLASGTDVSGDLVLLVVTAVVGGFVANAVRLPLVVGYIVGGLIVGPSVSGLITDTEQVSFVGELGVALLLFSIGLEFPFEQFRRLGRRLVIAAVFQITFIGSVGYAIALGFGLNATGATLVAGATAFSSTALLVRMLSQQGDRGRPDNRWVLSVALVQDLAAVPLLVVLPQLGQGSGSELLQDVLIALGKGVGLVIGVVIVGRFFVPWALRQALAVGSRELFLMSVFAIGVGVALGSFAVGLSLAFGAFLAGVVTAQSVYASRALQELIPLRDLFAAAFFVSIGALLDVSVIGDAWDLFLAVLFWGVLAKILVIFALARWGGFAPSRALRMGLLLGQVGEFAFLFAEAVDDSVAGQAGQIIIAVAATSIAVSAALIRLSDQIERWLLKLPGLADRWTPEPQAIGPTDELRQHTVIAGYGESGRELARALTLRDFTFIAIDFDPALPSEMADRGIPFIWGDLTNPATLDGAHLEHARVLAITITDPVVAEAIVRRAHDDHPRLHVVVRGGGRDSNARLRDAGASVIVDPAREIGLEVAYHALHWYGVGVLEIRQAQAQRRREFGD